MFNFSEKFINIALFVSLILAWSFTWFTAKILVNMSVLQPELLAGYRFLGAGIVLMVVFFLINLKKSTLHKLIPSKSDIKFCMISSFFGCSVNLVLFYYAAKYLVSGFSAVIFSMIIIFNLIIGIFFGIKHAAFWKILLFSILGVIGLFLIVVSHSGFENIFSKKMLVGLLLGFLGTVSFSISSLYFQTHKKFKIESSICFAYMCFFGFLWCVVIMLFHCILWNLPIVFFVSMNTKEILAFLHLIIIGTVVGYLCSFMLSRRIGSVKAGYASLITPLFAIATSAVYEGYNFTILTIIGFICILVSEFFALTNKK